MPTSILDRLREDGWGTELDYMTEHDLYAFREQPYVRKPAKLTDRGTPNHFARTFRITH